MWYITTQQQCYGFMVELHSGRGVVFARVQPKCNSTANVPLGGQCGDVPGEQIAILLCHILF
jgi:hypothetical protein